MSDIGAAEVSHLAGSLIAHNSTSRFSRPLPCRLTHYLASHANVAELADAQDLGSCPARGAGSTPAVRTYLSVNNFRGLKLLTLALETAPPMAKAVAVRCRRVVFVGVVAARRETHPHRSDSLVIA
jgi:hypothetical protein